MPNTLKQCIKNCPSGEFSEGLNGPRFYKSEGKKTFAFACLASTSQDLESKPECYILEGVRNDMEVEMERCALDTEQRPVSCAESCLQQPLCYGTLKHPLRFSEVPSTAPKAH